MAEIEYYTWPDKIAGELSGKKHVVHGMWTPSGYFHIGNSRTELFIPGLVHKALLDKGLKSTQNLLVDDFDDFDKVPSGFDKDKFAEFLGKPLVNVPSPVSGYDSWSEYFKEDMASAIDKFDLSPNIISSYNAYKKGVYNDAIKIVLDKARSVRDVWVRITKSEKPVDWLPIIIVCENCGKSATTVGTGWDGKKLKYACSNDRDYCKSCGYEGEVEPKDGKAKLPWRIHWSACWYIYGTTFESAGKDHFTKGGSVDTSRAFCKEIFGKEPPTQVPAEFIQLGKEKISGSRGNVITMHDWLNIAEPELLRFLMLSYQPNTVIDFDLKSNKLFLLADRYDRVERIYFGEKIDDKKKESQAKREYELSQIA
ncbi:MAG: lysine--tRNA ligase, partial [Candidatus Aenigmatarchaeota archaeon]